LVYDYTGIGTFATNYSSAPTRFGLFGYKRDLAFMDFAQACRHGHMGKQCRSSTLPHTKCDPFLSSMIQSCLYTHLSSQAHGSTPPRLMPTLRACLTCAKRCKRQHSRQGHLGGQRMGSTCTIQGGLDAAYIALCQASRGAM